MWLPLSIGRIGPEVSDGFLLIIAKEDKNPVLFISSTDLNKWRRGEIEQITPVNAVLQCHIENMKEYEYYKVVC